MNFKTVATDATLEKVAKALTLNGFNAQVVENLQQAKAVVLEMIPEGSEVMTSTSVTLHETGIAEEIEESGKYKAVKKTLADMNRETDHRKMQMLGAAPEYVLGSVHAVTHNGHVLIASNSGSQLSGYAYGADHVIWVVGAQKIVKDVEEGMQRINEYVLPLESERAHKAYGVPGSFVSKVLLMNREPNPTRISIVLIKEPAGY